MGSIHVTKNRTIWQPVRVVEGEKKKKRQYRNTIWQLAQTIGSGYKNAGQDYLSPIWVLRHLVKVFGNPNHEKLADITLEKMKADRKNKKQILIEAFAQAAAESRKQTNERVATNRQEDGWTDVAGIVRDHERPAIATVRPKDKDIIVSQVPCICRGRECAGNCGGACGCERCARTSLLRDRLAARETAAG